MRLEVVKSTDAVEGVPYDQERPAFADYLQGGGERAVLPLIATAQHAKNITGSIIELDMVPVMSSVIERNAATDRDGVRVSRMSWLSLAAVLCATGWGSNQITPMEVYYRLHLHLSSGTEQAMFGVYALGLIPGLLVAGPLSDVKGRRPVVLPGAALSLLATASLVAGEHNVAMLFVGRLLAGFASGAVFSAGSAWLGEISRAGDDNTDAHTVARRVTVAMTLGFGTGPVVAGLLAQWGPAPGWVSYLPALVFAAVALAASIRLPETATPRPREQLRLGSGIKPADRRRFAAVVVPMAPWVFASMALAFSYLPDVLNAGNSHDGIALVGALTGLALICGVLVQPFARRLEARRRNSPAARVGLVVLIAGLLVAVATAWGHRLWMLAICAVVLGCAYGLLMVAGLVETQKLADPERIGQATALFLALTYLGFGLPFLLALVAPLATVAVLLGGVTVVALLAAVVVITRT